MGQKVNPIVEQLKSVRLFHALTTSELEQLSQACRLQSFAAGAKIVDESDVGYDFYVLTAGSVSVVKKSPEGISLQIGTLKPGATFGELAFLEEGLRAATIKTLEPTQVICIDGETLKTSYFEQILAKLRGAMAEMLSERLKATNAVTVQSMQAEISALKKQVATGLMLTSIIFLGACYEFALGFVLSIRDLFPSTTPISVAMIVAYAAILLITIWRGGYPLANYGLTWRGGWASVRQAVLYSLPLMGLILFAKWVLINIVPGFEQYPLFQPMLPIKGGAAGGLNVYLITVGAYALFCPVQEFIARGALQGSLEMFLPKKEGKSTLIAILLSNLVFASSHMHTNYKFALLAFVPGLFWGWMFSKQRSLVGVSVSHILIGIWVSFAVGFPGLTGPLAST